MVLDFLLISPHVPSIFIETQQQIWCLVSMVIIGSKNGLTSYLANSKIGPIDFLTFIYVVVNL